ncbi:uncharacterized protein LOC121857500 [Homarus americanus]|uniref:uncharacterized protein LOC121857500 n=1 Tax=Homarus americanus TaxID=6706 RepID=UPI001C491203|nr:uncharacterized protein LOC121857500 [Homarus americanus]
MVSVWLLCQPPLKTAHVNRYFLLLAICDISVCLSYIPVIITVTGCQLSTYGLAYYFAHFCWTITCTCHAFGTYTILWLAFDRFMAVWMYIYYQKTHKSGYFMRMRIIITYIGCFMLHLPYMIRGNVGCANVDERDVYTCPNSSWVSLDGFEYDFNEPWHQTYRYIYSFSVRWLPSLLLVICNLGMILGVYKGKINFPSGHIGKRNGERNLIITMIAMTASYIIFTTPITIYLTFYADKRCTDSPEENLRHIGNSLQLFEHVTHIVFLIALNTKFRKQIRIILHISQPGDELDSKVYSESSENKTLRDKALRDKALRYKELRDKELRDKPLRDTMCISQMQRESEGDSIFTN